MQRDEQQTKRDDDCCVSGDLPAKGHGHEHKTTPKLERFSLDSAAPVPRPNFCVNPTSNRPYKAGATGRNCMRKLWKTLFILVVLAGVSAGVYAWTRNGKKGDGGFKEVEVAQGSIVEKAVAVGQIQPRQKFSVKSKISVIVKRALGQVGDTV